MKSLLMATVLFASMTASAAVICPGEPSVFIQPNFDELSSSIVKVAENDGTLVRAQSLRDFSQGRRQVYSYNIEALMTLNGRMANVSMTTRSEEFGKRIFATVTINGNTQTDIKCTEVDDQ